jgi:geranylgeranyl pyrophosphate synthase
MSVRFDLPAVLNMPDLPYHLEKVEACIEATLSTNQSELTKAVLRLTKARGKRLRPALVIAAALLSLEEVDESVIHAATAVELIHIGSLIHDDIIDEAATRWKLPTINAREGLNYAVLGGDFLFANACMLAGKVSQEAGTIAAKTIVELCNGQTAELEAQNSITRTEPQLNKAIHGKTATLMAAACGLGGLCARQPKDKFQALADFGSNFGMAFQLVDDVLDFVSNETLLGKPTGNDVREGVYTLPVILALKGPNKKQVEALLKMTGSHEALTELLLQGGSINQTIAKARQSNEAARNLLSQAFGGKATALGQLPDHYLAWALSNLVAPKFQTGIAFT